MEFLHAFFKYRCTSWTPVTNIPAFPGGEFIIQGSSMRRTTKSHDFVLAVMPQYTFYTFPENAKSMTFGQLFDDCFKQLQCKGYATDFAPLLKELMRENIPEPEFLGDFMKLFFGPTLPVSRQLDSDRVTVEAVTGIDISGVIHQVQRCNHHSKMLWSGSLLG